MLQFICLSLHPLGPTGEASGSRRHGTVIRTEWAVGGREASHHIMLSATRSIDLQERLATSEDCSAVAQNTIRWTSRPDGSKTTEFCITAIPDFYASNVIVRISVPPLQSDYERQVMIGFGFISSCRIDRGPDLFIQGDRFVNGRVLIVPPTNLRPE
jgi:hypothetical protein